MAKHKGRGVGGTDVPMPNGASANGAGLAGVSGPGTGIAGERGDCAPQRASRTIAACSDVSLISEPAGIVVAVGRRAVPPGNPSGQDRASGETVDGIRLRDLVREATYAIESRGILIALERAGGNRAQAAQMLGLSRQSLYVKLRRFGLGGLGADSDR